MDLGKLRLKNKVDTQPVSVLSKGEKGHSRRERPPPSRGPRRAERPINVGMLCRDYNCTPILDHFWDAS